MAVVLEPFGVSKEQEGTCSQNLVVIFNIRYSCKWFSWNVLNESRLPVKALRKPYSNILAFRIKVDYKSHLTYSLVTLWLKEGFQSLRGRFTAAIKLGSMLVHFLTKNMVFKVVHAVPPHFLKNLKNSKLTHTDNNKERTVWSSESIFELFVQTICPLHTTSPHTTRRSVEYVNMGEGYRRGWPVRSTRYRF